MGVTSNFIQGYNNNSSNTQTTDAGSQRGLLGLNVNASSLTSRPDYGP